MMNRASVQNTHMASKHFVSPRFGNTVTIAFWLIALSSHAFLLPKLWRAFVQENDK